jgi:SAM-dependent methyltransferase
MSRDSECARKKRAPLFMHELLAALEPGAVVLDLGCGNGSFDYADFPHLSIHAVDRFTPEHLDQFPRHVDFCMSLAEELPYSDSTFDLVIGNFVFEHFSDLASAIREVDRILRRDSYLYMSVPNSRSFEDELYRSLYHGGGHLQRFTFESILHHVYSSTRLKLVSYADWPGGFTYLQDEEAVRHFIFSVLESVRQVSGLDLRMRCNYIMLFRREQTLGFRPVTRVCTYCGAGDGIDDQSQSNDVAWHCRICGRTNSWRRLSLRDKVWLQTDARHLCKRLPPVGHTQPEGGAPDGASSIHPYDLEELRYVAHLSRTLRNSRFSALARKLLRKIL